VIGGAGTGIEDGTTAAGLITMAGAWGTAGGFGAVGIAAMVVAAVGLVVILEPAGMFWSKAARASAWAGLSPVPGDET